MSAGAIRAAYMYEYMSTPSLNSDASQAFHLNDLHSAGLTHALVKMLTEAATPLQLRYWRAWQARGESLGMTVIPVFNYQNSTVLDQQSTPSRRYHTTASAASRLSTIACPIDPVYLRAIWTNSFQRLPRAPWIISDGEFPGGPGGFHNYVAPCHCDGCKVDYYRSVNCPGEHCVIDPDEVTLPSDATLLAFEQSRHQSLVTQYAAQAGTYTTVGLTDFATDDSFIASTVAGLVAAGKIVYTFSEKTYATSGQAPQSYTGATSLGGLWLEKWSPSGLATEISLRSSPGYWLFTTFSFWLGQTAVNTVGSPYDLPLASSTTGIADYLSALTGVNT